MKLDTPIAQGNTAKIYLYENQIIKLFHDYLPEGEAEYEATKQKLAYSLGLSVPTIIDVTKIDGKQAIIMEYVKGKTLGDLLTENEDQVENIIGLSVEIQQKIHQVSAKSFTPMREKLKHRIQSVKELTETQKNKLLEKLDSMPVKNSLCHGDFHLYNLIRDKDRVYIIDWVDASSGNIEADVCRTYLLYLQFSIELAELYITTYCQKSGLFREEILEWLPIIAGARISEIVKDESSERLIEIVKRYCSED